jgi:hypothetical protein
MVSSTRESSERTLLQKRFIEEDTLQTPQARRGKWTVQEEVYAEYIIQCFRTGNLSDCDQNTSLRAYLANKLNCKPMRVTKKYSGNPSYDCSVPFLKKTENEIDSQEKLHHLRQLFRSSVKQKRKRSHRKVSNPVEKLIKDTSYLTYEHMESRLISSDIHFTSISESEKNISFENEEDYSFCSFEADKNVASTKSFTSEVKVVTDFHAIGSKDYDAIETDYKLIGSNL